MRGAVWVLLAWVATGCGGLSSSLQVAAPTGTAYEEAHATPRPEAGGSLEGAPDQAALATSPAAPPTSSEGTAPGAEGAALTAVVVRRGGGGDQEGAERLVRDVPAPLLVYTASLGLMVDGAEIAATIDRVIEEAVRIGGYLAARTDTTVQVRVPSSHFREGMSAFQQLGEVTHQQVSAQDVTEEYHDLSVRLENLRAIRNRLEQFLSRAQNIEEVLRVHAELERVSREIDQMEGRLRFLRAQVAFSTVSVALTARPAPVVVAEVAREPAPPPPPARRPNLPVGWLGELGLDRLIDFGEEG